jgi:valyl-tRNA synthetase
MSKKILQKVYEPKAVEERWSKWWIEKNLFTPDMDSKKPTFTMVIPPPNITGSLHLGHALNNTLQDIMARYKRMRGFNVLWLPGIDHAGIATQNVVEKQLHREGLDRHKLGRERFLERVWRWKEESGGAILNQLKLLGASCDWTRLRFTMDEGLSKAVREVFVRLSSEGLIYRGNYIINWCPRCQTALSDLEVEHEETEGSLWYIEYPIKDGKGAVTVATTRPETMLGDVAVSVNPEDKRYKELIGKTLMLPLADRDIPVIADQMVDMEFGTGALKITPAHDFNDFETAKTHRLDSVKVMDLEARMNENAGKYSGMDRFSARKKVVADLKGLGLLKKVEPYRLLIGSCYRCKTVVEPTLSKQWFVRVAPLAEPAIRAVEEGRTRFVPRMWENTYFDWMRNIRDWCISRQIWWGHRIPAWHCKDCEHVTVASKDPSACQRCGSAELEQDPDVLDTWFSSALWPLSTLGWPEKSRDIELFYPTTALFTSFDIIFFWVARMIMMGEKFMGEVPFKDVYIHALIRDARGQKMSKSRHNVIDPLVMMDRYGTDSLRFTLAAFAAQGRDIKFAEERIEGYRNFANKLWNLARFTLMNLDERLEAVPDAKQYNAADKWIITRLGVCAEEVRKGLEGYEFDVPARALYRFLWHELCDWYVELVKPDLKGELGEERRAVSCGVLLSVLKDTLKMLHPFMPFITEEIFSYLPSTKPSIMSAGFPEKEPGKAGKWPEETSRMETVMDIIRAVRNIRTEMNISPKTLLECMCFCGNVSLTNEILKGEGYIKKLASVQKLTVSEDGERPGGAAFAIAKGDGPLQRVEVFVPLKGHVDFDRETNRLTRELEKVIKESTAVQKKLANEDFLKKAPAEVVEKERIKLDGLVGKRDKIEAGLERIKGLTKEGL